MELLFKTVFQMSLISSYVILIILCLRFFIRKQPKILSYALWGIVFLRLICPFSVTKNFSLIPGFLMSEKNQTSNISTLDKTSENKFSSTSQMITQPTEEIRIEASFYENNSSQFLDKNEHQVSGYLDNHKTINIKTLIPFIWLTGTIFLILCNIVQIIVLKYHLRNSVKISTNIFETDITNHSFLLGLFNPRIYISKNLKGSDREYILCHEKAHLCHKDNLLKPAALLITCIHWFNPLVWFSFYFMCQDMEMACDESVMKKYNGLKKIEYSYLLLNAAKSNNNKNFNMLSFGKNSVKSRVANILKYRKPVKWICAIITVLILSIGLCLFVNPVNRPQINDNNNFKVPENTNTNLEQAIKTQAETVNMTAEEFGDWIIICIKNNDKENLAELIHYPITPWTNPENGVIKDKQQFIEFYNQIITEDIKKSIVETDLNNIFSNWQGSMLGNGELWFSKITDSEGYFITSINAGEAQNYEEADSKLYWMEHSLKYNKITKIQAEEWYNTFLRDNLHIQEEYDLYSAVVDDFDNNGEIDIVIQSRLKDGQITTDAYKGAYLYIYMNGTIAYEKSWESNLFLGTNYIVSGDFDHDNQTEIVYTIFTGGVGAAGSNYKELLKYKDDRLVPMELPGTTTDNNIDRNSDFYDIEIPVSVEMASERGLYTAKSPYLENYTDIHNSITFNGESFKNETGNFSYNWTPGYTVGGNVRGYFGFKVVHKNGRDYLKALEYLSGEGGISHCVGWAEFLFDWDENGNSKIIDFNVTIPDTN